MTGPTIIRDASNDPQPGDLGEVAEAGIRKMPSGAWVAIRDKRFVGEFRGPGAKRAAIEAAGTNEVVA